MVFHFVAMVHVIDVTVDLLASTFSLASTWDVGQSLCGTKSATRKEEVEDKSVTAGPNGVHLSNQRLCCGQWKAMLVIGKESSW